MHSSPTIHWIESGQNCSALWRSERGAAPPKRVVLADDTTTADDAYHLACAGTALLWRGDFQNARQDWFSTISAACACKGCPISDGMD